MLAEEGSIKANSKVLIIDTSSTGAKPATPATVPIEQTKPKSAETSPATPTPPPIPSKLPKAESIPSTPKLTVPISNIPVTPYKPAESSSTQNVNKICGTRSESRVKMSKMRQTVASRLKASQNTCAMLTTFNEINMG